jgi:hypothetical protein
MPTRDAQVRPRLPAQADVVLAKQPGMLVNDLAGLYVHPSSAQVTGSSAQRFRLSRSSAQLTVERSLGLCLPSSAARSATFRD